MANDITILSCPQCGFPKIRDVGNGLYQCDDCGTHFDKNENIVQTNEEWFCNLSTEEKAKIFHKIFMARTFCHICPAGGVCDIGYKCKYHGGNTKDFVEWLKQPHTRE